jgi:hypothetical protein
MPLRGHSHIQRQEYHTYPYPPVVITAGRFASRQGDATHPSRRAYAGPTAVPGGREAGLRRGTSCLSNSPSVVSFRLVVSSAGGDLGTPGQVGETSYAGAGAGS